MGMDRKYTYMVTADSCVRPETCQIVRWVWRNISRLALTLTSPWSNKVLQIYRVQEGRDGASIWCPGSLIEAMTKNGIGASATCRQRRERPGRQSHCFGVVIHSGTIGWRRDSWLNRMCAECPPSRGVLISERSSPGGGGGGGGDLDAE